jgi:hypothetical protein
MRRRRSLDPFAERVPVPKHSRLKRSSPKNHKPKRNLQFRTLLLAVQLAGAAVVAVGADGVAVDVSRQLLKLLPPLQ